MQTAVTIIERGTLKSFECDGVTSIECPLQIDKNTNFRIASVSKAMTAMVIMILAERGLLKLDDTIATFLPQFSNCSPFITIRQLLSHTSGVIDYEPLIMKSRTQQITDSEAVVLVALQNHYYFEPNSQYRYSNSGYVILSTIAANLTGTRFSKLIEQLIFTPLKMDASVAFESGFNFVKNRAYGHSLIEGVLTQTDQSITSATLGDGGIYTNAVDFVKWDSALSSNLLVSEDMLRQAFTPAKLNSGEMTNYGFGWEIAKISGWDCYYHTGSSIGFRSAYLKFPKNGLSIYVTSNLSCTDALAIAKTAVLEIQKN